MYIRKVHIENIRSIEKLDWEVPEGKEAGWHVLIGDNGAGKSTVLRAIALAIIGKDLFGGLRQKAQSWLRYSHQEGKIIVNPDFYLDVIAIFMCVRPGSRNDETNQGCLAL